MLSSPSEVGHKPPGTYWIDFPLLANEIVLGKLILHCDDGLLPEHFELLTVLAEMLTGLLDAFKRREELERLEQIRQGAEQSMATIMHNIVTQMAPFPALLTLYRRQEKNFAALGKPNQRFARILDEIYETVKRTHERLSVVTPRVSELKIVEEVEEISSSFFNDSEWQVNASDRTQTIHFDANYFRVALQELIQNSKDFIPDTTPPQISISIEETDQNGEPEIQLIYRDNGPGIPDDLKGRIFDDLFSHRPQQEEVSTGLGLAFVQRVIKAHHGRIYEQGIFGQGVEFVIEFPSHYQSDNGVSEREKE